MSKPNRRRVNMAKFKQQIAEQVIGPDNLIEVQVDDENSVWIKLPVALDEDDDFEARLRASTTGEEMATVVLGGHPEHTAEDQLEAWTGAGHTLEDLAKVFATETAAARDRLGKFRYAG